MLYVICFISISLSIAVMLVWFFQCRPFMSNFSFKSKVQWCLNIDAARYSMSIQYPDRRIQLRQCSVGSGQHRNRFGARLHTDRHGPSGPPLEEGSKGVVRRILR